MVNLFSVQQNENHRPKKIKFTLSSGTKTRLKMVARFAVEERRTRKDAVNDTPLEAASSGSTILQFHRAKSDV